MFSPIYCYAPSSGSESNEKPVFNRNLESIVNGKDGKMFVGGLNSNTSAEGLRFYFSQFGAIEDTVIMRDTKTRLSRGFGFVTFYDPANIDKVLAFKGHFLDGKKVDPQRAIKSISPARSVHNIYKKIFIGGVSQSTSVEDLKKYFSERFGCVEDVFLKTDYPKLTHRGFGFITFLDESAADKVCAIRHHKINGKTVETKLAQKKEFVNLNPTTHEVVNLNSTAAHELSSQDYIRSFWPKTPTSSSANSSSCTSPWSVDCEPSFSQTQQHPFFGGIEMSFSQAQQHSFFNDSETDYRKHLKEKYTSQAFSFAF